MSTKTNTRLPLYLKCSYSFADVTFSLMVTLSNTYAQFFLTDIAFFPTTIVASILFFGRILDALSVPVTGGIIDRSNLKWGKFRPWLVVGSVLTLLFNVLIFKNDSFIFDIGFLIPDTVNDGIWIYFTARPLIHSLFQKDGICGFRFRMHRLPGIARQARFSPAVLCVSWFGVSPRYRCGPAQIPTAGHSGR